MSSWKNMEEKINHLLTKLTIAHRIANEKLMCEIGLHSGQVQILSSLWEKDGQSQAELVRNLCVSPPTVNKMVSKLTESGFVFKKKCPNDKRLMRVYLKDKGISAQPSVEKQWKRLEKLILKEISETEKLLIPILIRKISTNLTSEIN